MLVKSMNPKSPPQCSPEHPWRVETFPTHQARRDFHHLDLITDPKLWSALVEMPKPFHAQRLNRFGASPSTSQFNGKLTKPSRAEPNAETRRDRGETQSPKATPSLQTSALPGPCKQGNSILHLLSSILVAPQFGCGFAARHPDTRPRLRGRWLLHPVTGALR